MNFFFENPKHEIYGIYGQSLAVHTPRTFTTTWSWWE